jgi:hypothetical protein
VVAAGGKSFAPIFLPNRELAMPSTPSRPSDRDPLQSLLKDTEEELRNRLHAACEAEAKGVSTESTEQIRRLEDDLLAAAVAAKQTIHVRSHMKQVAQSEERERPIKTDVANGDIRSTTSRTDKPALKLEESGERQVMGVREFNDDRGMPWRAWSVVPGLSRASATGGSFLGNFQDGWICFESLGSSARRRLPFPRAKWPTLTDDELRRLLERAADAPLREKKA